MLRPGQPVLEWQQAHDAPLLSANPQAAARAPAHRLLLVGRAAMGYSGSSVPPGLSARGGASLIPIKPGERIKTDRRDAKKLAEMLRAELLTMVQPPTEEEEAV
jgi:hypothetical protein